MSLEKPNYLSRDDRMLYDELFYHDNERELTQKEKDFCKSMYHQEEFACGLDGDIEEWYCKKED